MVDLKGFGVKEKAEQGQVLELLGPDMRTPLMDGANPVTITLAGRDSEKFQRALKAAGNRRLKVGGRRGGPNAITMDEVEADNIGAFAAATIAWTGIEYEGAPLECTLANAKRVYTEQIWVREQVEDFVNERANFLKDDSTS